jgi:predicted RNA binding protein YcfA (HicA-like mRNA interferase family)
MPKFPVLKPRELISAFKKMGFELIRISGSHYHLKKSDKLVTIPYHNRDLRIKNTQINI